MLAVDRGDGSRYRAIPRNRQAGAVQANQGQNGCPQPPIGANQRIHANRSEGLGGSKAAHGWIKNDPGGGSKTTQGWIKNDPGGGSKTTHKLDPITRSPQLDPSLSQERERPREDFNFEEDGIPQELIDFVISENPGTDRPRAYALYLLKHDRAYWESRQQAKFSPDPLQEPIHADGVEDVPPPTEVDPRQSAIAKAQALADGIKEGSPMAAILAQQVERICTQWAIPYPEGFTPLQGASRG